MVEAAVATHRLVSPSGVSLPSARRPLQHWWVAGGLLRHCRCQRQRAAGGAGCHSPPGGGLPQPAGG